ncbi:NAD-dependent epimerase/dehydratase family protein [Candidatus Pelagibacter sp. HIMB1509]|uniref:NAD-dependent epimerase/dehydratase family protein n=1 Tax=Candidatus Pelagibacter sp. HIMB1509 TaxID=3413339 RepID=UPI003F833513
MIKKNSKIFIAGHNGHLGSAIYRILYKNGYKNILTVDKKKINLLNQTKVFNFIKKNKPNLVIIAAAKVGGIYANNKYRGKFIYENLQIQNNLIHGAYLSGVKNLIFFGSSCIYPEGITKPISEKLLLSGTLEYTNEPYAIAKIAGIKLCESYNIEYKTNYKCLMPCNSYGPKDNYHNKNSHFFAALIKKILYAKKDKKKYIEIWGSGKPKREIIYVDDIAMACLYFMKKKTKETLINIGSGKDYSIETYAKKIMKHLNVKFKIKKNKKMPDGIKRKLLNINLAKSYGWRPTIGFKEGLDLTIKDFKKSFI